MPTGNVDKLHARARLVKSEECSSLSLQASCARATSQLSGARASDLLTATFGGSVVYWTNGAKSGGTRPDWLDWPSHTAAEMGPGPKVNPVAFAKPAPKRVRA